MRFVDISIRSMTDLAFSAGIGLVAGARPARADICFDL